MTNVLWNFSELYRRIDHPELLDIGMGSPAQVAESLNEMWRINRYLGGLSSLTAHLYPRITKLKAKQKEISVLDLGTGSAHIPVALVQWARRRRTALTVTAVDLSTRHLKFARANTRGFPEIKLMGADIAHLPFAPKSFDFVISSLFVHHFSPPALILLLQTAAGLARHSVVMNDLVRGRLPLLAFKMVQPIFARCELTQHDGALSIRRSYTPPELKNLAVQAGLPNVHVQAHFPWRMTLTSDLPTRTDTA